MKILLAALLATSAAADPVYVTQTSYLNHAGLQPFCITERSARAVLTSPPEYAVQVFDNVGDCQFAKAGTRYQIMQEDSSARNLRRVLILSESGPNVEVWFFFGQDIEEAAHE